MSSETTTRCPHCGHESEDVQWCDHCGSEIHLKDSAEGVESVWLEAGARFQVQCELHELDLAPYLGQALLEIEIEEVVETSSVRHISKARAISVVEINAPTEAREELDEEKLRRQLKAMRFSVEELSALLGAQQSGPPPELTHLVRLPAGECARGEHAVMVFGEDGSQTLEEYVIARQGQLEYQEVKQIFTALLDLCEQLHSHDYLYLRLSPWTLRVVQQRDNGSGTLLGAEETFVEDEDGVDNAQVDAAKEPLEHDEVSQKEDAGDEDEGDDDAVDQVDRDDEEEAPEEAGEREMDDASHLPLADEAPTLGEAEASLAQLRETTQMAAVTPKTRAAISRALLDGGSRFYRPDQEYDELPVVMGFSPTEMFGRAQVPLAAGYDIFSIGMILYYLTCGTLPPTSIYTRHTPAVPARHFRPDFPIGLQTVIGRATRADIQERFVDVASMREAFERACEVIEARIAIMRRGEVPRVALAVERHVGIAKRLRNPINQDAVFSGLSEDQRFAVVVVADGVSTASFGSGDLASQQIAAVAVERWPEHLERYEAGQEIDEFELIYQLLDEANQRIIDYVNAHHLPFDGPPQEVMGTTTLVAVLHKGIVTLGSLGDSRAYLQRGTSFEQITIDHNLWTLRVLDGYSADHALSLPHSDALARCLGTFYVEEGKLFATSPQPDIFRFPIIAGDTLLLATDGLLDFAGPNHVTSEDHTLSVLLSEPNPALAALELILLANRGGGGDNIGVGIAKFV